MLNDCIGLIDHMTNRCIQEEDQFTLVPCENDTLRYLSSIITKLCNSSKIFSFEAIEKGIIGALVILMKPAYERNEFMPHLILLPLLPLLTNHPAVQ